MTRKKQSLINFTNLFLIFLIGASLILASCSDDDADIVPVIQTQKILEDGDELRSESTNGLTVTVPEDATVTLVGQVKFHSGTTLVIEPGATIKGNPNLTSYLIIDRGAKIEAIGTAEKPITFTSGKDEGERGQEDWGGIVINGYADINSGDSAYGEGDSGLYGGNNDEDNSGTMQYVRIYFAGKVLTGTDELNGLCLQGVGSGTTIDHVQMHNCKDDGIEMFGGNVNLKYIVSTGNGDDQIDCTLGWRGKVQFAACAPLPGGDSNFEHDSNEVDHSATPQTNVTYYNVTCVRGDGDDVRGARMRRGTVAAFHNSYFAGSQDDRAIYSEDTESEVTVGNCLIEQNGTVGYTEDGGTVTASDLTVDNAPATPYIDLSNFATFAALESAGASAFVPQSGATNANVAAAIPPNDGFFDTSATFLGAVEDSSNNWISGWTSFPAD
ncbi:MAG: hypothetical protein SVZ03_01655 [Spirochaetota bacterium]|nr:hypothetical protein [Spirochaetota bacterium]